MGSAVNVEHIVCELAQAIAAKRVAYYAQDNHTNAQQTALNKLSTANAAFDAVTLANAIAANERGEFLVVLRQQIMNRDDAPMVAELLRPLIPGL